MKLVYWNIKNLLNWDVVLSLTETEDPDVLFLSELSSSNIPAIETCILANGYRHLETPGCTRVVTFHKADIAVDLLKQGSHYSMLRLSKGADSINTVSLHLPSEMFSHMDALKQFLRRLRSDIELNIGLSTEEEIVIIGDFNANPFESPLIAFDGLAATNNRFPRRTIKHNEETVTSFVNPTWRLFARSDYPGTLKYNRPSGYSFDILEWHYLDQVVISHRLNMAIENDSIRVVESTKRYVHFDPRSGKVDQSDHLPISYDFVRS